MEVKKEEKKEFSYIKNLVNLVKDGKVGSLSNEFKGFTKAMDKKISEKAKSFAKQKAEELAKIKAEEEKAKQVEVAPVQPIVEEKPVVEVKPVVEEKTVVEEKPVVEVAQEPETPAPIPAPEKVEEQKPVEAEPEKPKAPVIQKTDNPNIVIIDGKRVFVPKVREFTPKADNNNANKGAKKPSNVGRTYNAEGGAGKKDFGDKGERKPFNQGGARPSAPAAAPAFVPKESTKQQGKKKNERNNYDDKKAINKKSLSKGQVSIDDFDEDKTGYRKVRKSKDKRQEESVATVKIEKAIINKEIIPVKELSELLGITAVEITKRLFKEGILKTINDSIDYDTAGFIAAELGIELELKLDKTAEDVLSEGFKDEDEDEAKLIKRPPVVTVMGHVDHGKTSLLDRIRNANVTAGEAGGITQHIGAYTVTVNGETVTFLDTPGHAAFTAMRARGAQLTDIAIIVVAADDGIMPQTIEAIHHAKAAGVTIIVAANKIDKPTADIEKVKKGLADQEILVEEWGGDVALVPVSAKTGAGIDELLETVILSAEMKELKANPDRMAKGIIVEAKLDKGKGPVATVLVQKGTLKVGDYLVAGTITGKVRAMVDDKGRNVKTAGPSMPVSILGLESVPNAGDSLFAVEEAKLGALVASERKNREREEMIREQQKISLDDLFSKVSSGDLKNLNLIV